MTDPENICKLYRSGMGGRAIARLLRCDNRTVYKILRREGVQLRQGRFDVYLPTEEEIRHRKCEMLEQRGTILHTDMLADAY